MAARKIKLKDQLGRVINVPVATPPAAPVAPPVTQPDPTRPVATVWKLIREIPANIQKLAKLVGTGFTTRGPDGEWHQRSIEEGEGIAVADGDGVAGNPTIALAELPNAGGGTLQKTLRDGYGRMAGTSSATTDDLAEGGNLYFTDARADARATLAVDGHVAEVDPHPQYLERPGGTNRQIMRGDGTPGAGLLGSLGVGTEAPVRSLHVIGPDGVVPSRPNLGLRHIAVLENNNNCNYVAVGGATSDIGFFALVSGSDQLKGGFQYSSTNNWFHIIAGGAVWLIVRADNGNILPSTDNAQAIGEAANRLSTVYAGTGTINTSDAREKTPVRNLTDAELAAGAELGSGIGAYQWLAMVAEKGDSARQHIGMTVQGAIAVLESHGLNPFAYGFICYDEWSELPELIGEEGEVVQVFRPAGDRYSFRMDELLAFIGRGLAHRLDAVEQRLAAAGL